MERTLPLSDDEPVLDPAPGSEQTEPRFVILPPDLRRLVAHPLTPRELDVLRLIARGLTNRQIAQRLGVRDATVKAHVTRVFRRIGVKNRTEAAVWAACHGVLYERR